MRIEPNKIATDGNRRKKKLANKVTRVVALLLAGVSVFLFFFKLLFF